MGGKPYTQNFFFHITVKKVENSVIGKAPLRSAIENTSTLFENIRRKSFKF